MKRIYLTRRNLLTLLSKLDRAAKGESTTLTIVKNDTEHPKYPVTEEVMITAVEDKDYYTERKPGPVYPADDPDYGQKASS